VVSLIAAIAQQHYILPLRTFTDLAVGELLFGSRRAFCLLVQCQLGLGFTQVHTHFSNHLAAGVRVPNHNPVESNAINGTGLDISGPGVDTGRAEDVLAGGRRADLLLPESEQANWTLLQQIVTAAVGTEAGIWLIGRGLQSTRRAWRLVLVLFVVGLYLLTLASAGGPLIDLE